MNSNSFTILHPNEWKVLKVIQFTFRRGSCMTTGTILYDRPYKYDEYNEKTSDVVDETIKKGLTSLFEKIDCYSHILQLAGEDDDYQKLYCAGKDITGLCIRCMPIVEINPATVDCEKELIGFDFDFKIYLDYVDQGQSLPSLFTISAYAFQYQKIFERVSQMLREL